MSPILGGRGQVLATPFIESVKYVEMEQKKKKSDRWHSFLDNVYASKQGVDHRKFQKYVETIQPEQARKQLAKQTNMNQLKELKEKQERAKTIKQGG